jgi:hypothetical protein
MADPFYQFEEKNKETVEKINLVSDIAKQCLGLEVFQTYKKSYIDAEAKMIETLLSLTVVYQKGGMDLTNYGSRMLAYMIELKTLRSLLTRVERDAKKGADNEPAE